MAMSSGPVVHTHAYPCTPTRNSLTSTDDTHESLKNVDKPESLSTRKSLGYVGDLVCCGRTFGNMGALAVHEKCLHRGGKARVRPKKKLLRKSYPLRFKAAVLATYDNLRGLKCKACTAVLVPGSEVDSRRTWDLECDCGCKEYTRDMRYKGGSGVEVGGVCSVSDFADMVGIHKCGYQPLLRHQVQGRGVGWKWAGWVEVGTHGHSRLIAHLHTLSGSTRMSQTWSAFTSQL